MPVLHGPPERRVLDGLVAQPGRGPRPGLDLRGRGEPQQGQEEEGHAIGL